MMKKKKKKNKQTEALLAYTTMASAVLYFLFVETMLITIYIISFDSAKMCNVRRSIWLAKYTFQKLSSIIENRNTSLETMESVIKSYIISLMLYGN